MEYNVLSRFIGKGVEFAFDAYEAISTRLIKSHHLGISPRNLNYYKTQGLFFRDTATGKHLHVVFNFTEFVWFQMILEMRRFDIGLSTIKEVKELLETTLPFEEFMKEAAQSEKFLSKLPGDVKEEFMDMVHSNFNWKELEKEVPVNLLSMILSEAIVKRKQMSILVNLDGDIFPFSYTDFNELNDDESFRRFLEKTYVSISITEIIKRFISNFDLKLSTDKLMLLSEREAKMIKLLHDEKLESLTVHLDDSNSINLIETKETYNKLDKESRLLDIIMKNGYQTIEIKTQNGNIVYCKNLNKHVLK